MTAGPISRLALGTVQFGLAYGLASGHQKVLSADVEQILSDARQAGITQEISEISAGMASVS